MYCIVISVYCEGALVQYRTLILGTCENLDMLTSSTSIKLNYITDNRMKKVYWGGGALKAALDENWLVYGSTVNVAISDVSLVCFLPEKIDDVVASSVKITRGTLLLFFCEIVKIKKARELR